MRNWEEMCQGGFARTLQRRTIHLESVPMQGGGRMILVDGVWKQNKTVPNIDGEDVTALVTVPIMDVPVGELICKWEELVKELSMKEVELYNLKEAYLIAESKIVNEVDFKAIYGKNNEKIRKEHCKKELSDLVEQIKELEFGIAWINRYLPLLKEVVRIKQ